MGVGQQLGQPCLVRLRQFRMRTSAWQYHHHDLCDTADINVTIELASGARAAVLLLRAVHWADARPMADLQRFPVRDGVVNGCSFC